MPCPGPALWGELGLHGGGNRNQAEIPTHPASPGGLITGIFWFGLSFLRRKVIPLHRLPSEGWSGTARDAWSQAGPI